MKKSILILVFALLSLNMLSQNEGIFYEKQNLVKASRFLGTPASWHHLVDFMNVSSNPNNIYDSIGNPDFCQVGGYYMSRGSMIYYSEDGINTIVTDSLVFDSLYSSNRQLASDPHWRNDKSSYASISYVNSNYKSASYTPTLSISSYSIAVDGNTPLALPHPSVGLGYLPATGVTNINLSGTTQTVNRRATGVITPTIANSYTVNISGLGFTNITNVQCTAQKSTGTAIDVVFASILSVSTTQIVLSFIQGTTVVLGGASFTYANTSGLTARLEIEGN